MNCAEKLLEPTIFFNLYTKVRKVTKIRNRYNQVTIEIRFRKSLAQERFESNLEFRNQIIVSSIKFEKVLRSL